MKIYLEKSLNTPPLNLRLWPTNFVIKTKTNNTLPEGFHFNLNFCVYKDIRIILPDTFTQKNSVDK